MRLIDADKLDWWYKGRPIRRVIDEAPTIDAVPVVHGRWIWKGGCFHCSNCKTTNDHTPAYCEGRGAKMDGVQE